MRWDNFKEKKPNTFMQIHDTQHLGKVFVEKNIVCSLSGFQYDCMYDSNQRFLSLILSPLPMVKSLSCWICSFT